MGILFPAVVYATHGSVFHPDPEPLKEPSLWDYRFTLSVWLGAGILIALFYRDLALHSRLCEILELRSLCPACGYQLTGTPIADKRECVCPECGHKMRMLADNYGSDQPGAFSTFPRSAAFFSLEPSRLLPRMFFRAFAVFALVAAFAATSVWLFRHLQSKRLEAHRDQILASLKKNNDELFASPEHARKQVLLRSVVLRAYQDYAQQRGASPNAAVEWTEIYAQTDAGADDLMRSDFFPRIEAWERSSEVVPVIFPGPHPTISLTELGKHVPRLPVLFYVRASHASERHNAQMFESAMQAWLEIDDLDGEFNTLFTIDSLHNTLNSGLSLSSAGMAQLAIQLDRLSSKCSAIKYADLVRMECERRIGMFYASRESELEPTLEEADQSPWFGVRRPSPLASGLPVGTFEECVADIRRVKSLIESEVMKGPTNRNLLSIVPKYALVDLALDFNANDPFLNYRDRFLQTTVPTIVQLAIERFHADHGEYPASLLELWPQYLSAVPNDPWFGTPLGYRRLSGGAEPNSPGYLLYSFGNDRQDDQGQEGPMVGTFTSPTTTTPNTDCILNRTHLLPS